MFKWIIILFILAGLVMAIEAEDIPIEGVSYPAEWERDGKMYILNGELSHLQFYFKGDQEKVKKTDLIIELPDAFSVVYAFQCGEFKPGIPLEKKIEKKAISRDNKTYNRWQIPLNEKLLKGKLRKEFSSGDETAITVFIECLNPTGDIPPFYWHLEMKENAGTEKKIDAFLVSRLGMAKNSTRTKFLLYDTTLFSCPDEKVWDKIFAMYDKIGIRGGMTRSEHRKNADRKLASRGWEIYADAYGWGAWGGGFWGIHSADQISNDPEAILHVTKDGIKSKNHRAMCLTYLIENSGTDSLYFKKAEAFLKKWYFPGLFGYSNDYEIWPWTSAASPSNSCFCPRCLKAFSKFSKIDAEKLSPSDILAKHKNAWIDFRQLQLAKMMDIFARVVHAIDPKLKAIVSSAPAYSDRFRYPIDIKLFDKWIDEHHPQFYGNGPSLYRELEFNRKVLKKKIIAMLNCGFPAGEHKPISAKDLYLNTLAAAVSGCQGISYFTGSVSLDGEYLKAVYDAIKTISCVENFFIDGSPIANVAEIEGLPEKEITMEISGRKKLFRSPSWKGDLFSKIYCLEKDYLISVFNYHPDKNAYIKITVPKLQEGNYFLYDPVEKCLIAQQQKESWSGDDLKDGVILKVPTRNAGFWILTPKRPDAEKQIKEIDIRKEYEVIKNKSARNPEAANINNSLEQKEKFPSLYEKIKTPSQEIIIDLESGGRIWSWNVAGNELCKRNISPVDKGGFCIERLWSPSGIELESQKYQIQAKIENDKEVKISLYNDAALNSINILVQKVYRISKEDSSLQIHYSVSNKGKRPITFSFWLHNIPLLGEPCRMLSGSAEKGIDFFFFSDSGIKKISGKDTNTAELICNIPNTLADKNACMGNLEANNGIFAQYCAETKEAIAVKSDFNKLLQIYSCRIPALTIEWMYRTTSLNPGETWETSFRMVYFNEIEPDELRKKLLNL